MLTKISGFESNLARLKKENGMDIEFVFEEKKYRVDKNAVELNLIVLPSGKAIKADHWEGNPRDLLVSTRWKLFLMIFRPNREQ